MSATNKFVLWQWEKPINITANFPTTITWNPSTFGANNTNNFSINIWLERHDASTDPQQFIYPAILLAGNQNIFNSSTVQWTPTTDDIDSLPPQIGSHQMVINHADGSSNPVFTNAGAFFSTGFSINPPPGYNPTSASTSSTSTSETPSPVVSSVVSSPVTSSTRASQASNSSNPETISSNPDTSSSVPNTSSSKPGVASSTVIGLGIGLGVLFVLCIIGGVFFCRHRNRYKAQLQAVKVVDVLSAPEPPPKTPSTPERPESLESGNLVTTRYKHEVIPREIRNHHSLVFEMDSGGAVSELGNGAEPYRPYKNI